MAKPFLRSLKTISAYDVKDRRTVILLVLPKPIYSVVGIQK